jgi:glyoxylase-like metal-dependent hydrolase (beta-lactamase superfamily II)
MSVIQAKQSRRDWLRAAGGIVGAVALPFHAWRVSAADGDLARTPLSETLSVITGAGSNVVVLETDAGLALVDSGAPDHAAALVEFVEREFESKPVRLLFNTHWHPGSTGANELLARRGATIVAHENTRLWMSIEYYVDWEQTNYMPRPEAARPTDTFFSSDPQPLAHELGGYRIEYGHLAEAHTDGDIYVQFPADNVVAVGGVLAVDAFPVLDYSTGGWIGGSQGAMSTLLDLTDDSTRIVAADGPPQSRAALETQSALLDELGERIRVRMLAGKGIDEIIAENPFEGYESLPNPEQFVHNVYHGMWWGGRVRGAI